MHLEADGYRHVVHAIYIELREILGSLTAATEVLADMPPPGAPLDPALGTIHRTWAAPTLSEMHLAPPIDGPDAPRRPPPR